MRAIYLPELFLKIKTEVASDKVHHYLNVLKLSQDDIVLVLDGRGKSAKAKVEVVNKRKLYLNMITEPELHPRKSTISLLVGVVKKDALDLVLKNCCELGVESIVLAQTQFSQKYKLNMDRIHKLLVSSLEQSNNYYLPQVEQNVLEGFDFSSYENIFVLSTERRSTDIVPVLGGRDIIVIGPEGGFGEEDYKVLEKLTHLKLINLPSGILRTPNAVTCALGYLWGSSHKY